MALSDAHPFSIRIFVASGDPDGLRIVERSNWPGRALVFPRRLLPEIKIRPEFQLTGIYLLLGPREDGEGEMLYVGEGDPVLPRLESHFAKKDFWNRAAFFAAGSDSLNKAHVQYLEAQLLNRARLAKRLLLDNVQSPKLPTLNEADKADMDVFLEHMLQIFPLIGVTAFEVPRQKSKKGRLRLFVEAKGWRGEGYESNEGFVVLRGSKGPSEPAASMKSKRGSYFKLRQDLLDKEVLVSSGDFVQFAQDYSFSSPSAAAAVLLGRPANGRTEWKDESGRKLRDIQEQLSEEK